MKRYANTAEYEGGFTLIELIAAISLFAIVAGIIGSVTMFGFRSYHKITVENKLRDEADLVMSSIITQLYTYGPEEIQSTNSGIMLLRSDSDPLRIQVDGNDIEIGDSRIGPGSTAALHLDSALAGSTIAVTKVDENISNPNALYESGLVRIQLKLNYKGGASEGDELNVDSQFGF
ncbi:prepilin-type N-terminal cleavage/methylation domain-containing protein [Paenibacillus tritici]|uniref:Prepilin-type N-terminal cleavage/methylation domain-containing protein n=1 Tax=Paenibacillus tritici TaxID=1873425 RepID=A0ABX2DRC9_9BACL|nr:prepilin-type N-terminal cleavage/methylation domain-containing protein [Paenibacillus tritici]NQX47217.1 prepilin-type N-terminal cleavage/methylation domain-containing protein [Paenibacillus tritici]